MPLSRPLLLVLLVLAAACSSRGPETRTLIQGARVFDGERDLGAVDVLLEKGRIAAVGPRLAADGARVVDGKGATLLPGLFDAHVHVSVEAALEQELAFGVTTVIDLMARPDKAASLRRAGQRPDRASYLSAGNPVVAPGGAGTQYRVRYETVEDPSQIEAFIDRRVAEGSDLIKVVADDVSALGLRMPTLAPEVLARAIARAHHHRKVVVAHVTQRADAALVLERGADGLAHVFADAPPDAALIALARDRGAFVIPTLTAIASLTGRASAVGSDPALAPYLDRDDVANVGATGKARFGLGGSLRFEHALAAAHAFHAAGVPVLAGTDAANQGMAYGASVHEELALLVEAGLAPSEALRAATAAPARAFGLADRGRIAVGLRADVVLVEGDPTADIRATRAIRGVWRGGVAYDRARWRKHVASY